MADLIKELPIGKFVVGDCAYVCSEHLLTPFAGHNKLNAKQSSYNFYISQMRIRIEMAFGLMTEKWQILRRPMRTKLQNTGRVLMCITWLHNYCINVGDTIVDTSFQDLQEDNNDNEYNADPTITLLEGTSILRGRIVDSLFNRGLFRPEHTE